MRYLHGGLQYAPKKSWGWAFLAHATNRHLNAQHAAQNPERGTLEQEESTAAIAIGIGSRALVLSVAATDGQLAKVGDADFEQQISALALLRLGSQVLSLC